MKKPGFNAMDDRQIANLTLTIGAVSRATNIPANTLRTWERRYGFPQAERTPGGQRVYDPDVVPHLRLIGQALERGHRPRQILGIHIDELRQLLGVVEEPAPIIEGEGDGIDALVEATKRIDGPAVDRILRASLSRHGLVGFLRKTAVPFLREVGERWASGDIEVFHEHLASERVRRVVSARSSELGARPGAPGAVLACLPGEYHELPLQLAAAILAERGFRPIYFGANLPIDDIIGAVKQSRAEVLVVSASGAVAVDAAQQLEQLREALPGVRIAAGGEGVEPVEGVSVLPSIESLSDWAA